MAIVLFYTLFCIMENSIMRGNLFTINGVTVTIESIGVSMYSEKDYVVSVKGVNELFDMSDLHPITLSKQSLEMIGLVLKDCVYKKPSRCDIVDCTNHIVSISEQMEVSVVGEFVDIHFIHELQNLCTALKIK